MATCFGMIKTRKSSIFFFKGRSTKSINASKQSKRFKKVTLQEILRSGVINRR